MKTSLYRCDADGSRTVSIIDESVYNHNFGVSLDERIFAMPVLMPDFDALRMTVYDSDEGQILDIAHGHSFSLIARRHTPLLLANGLWRSQFIPSGYEYL